VRRRLLRSSSFVSAIQRLLRKHPIAAEALQQALAMLAEDAFHPKLRTHKLKGRLQGSWAASAGYDLRIIFDYVQKEGAEAVLLLTVGTHEEVY
jgi:mRNA-degrading endonuclease YafQ of YafQ-DinJ toxin-antitoxin module